MQVIREPYAKLNRRGQPRKYASQSSLRDFRRDVFITLFWMRNYPTVYVMSAMFGIDTIKLKEIVIRVLNAMESVWHVAVYWPDDEEIMQILQMNVTKTMPTLERIAFVIDGTEIRSTRSTTPSIQSKQYSPKKKQHSIDVQVICTMDGMIRYVSNPYVKSYDQKAFNALSIRQRFL